MDVSPPIVCPQCCRENPPEALCCMFCGNRLKTAAGGPLPRARLKGLNSLAVFGLITAVPSLYWNGLSGLDSGSSTAFRAFSIVFAILGIPLNLLLLAASVGLLLPPKPWARRLMFWWAGLISVYESVQLLVAVEWIAPHVTGRDLGSPELEQFYSVGSLFSLEYSIYWLSMMSLSAWAWWLLRRPSAREYFGSANAAPKPPVS